jgi:protein O-mannosyl-transferase
VTNPTSRTARADRGKSDAVPYSWIAPALAALAAYLAFTPVLDAGFVNYDDTGLFVDNPAYRALGAQNLQWMFTTPLAGHWAPLTWISHAIDFLASGLDPRAFHRTNLLLHAANAALFCVLAARILALARPRETEERPAALWIAAGAAALLFAVHPLRAESVGWITERRGLLCTFFLLPAVLAYLRSVRPGRVELASRSWYAASIVLLVLALLSKGLGLSFAAIVVALDVWPLRRPLTRAVWIQKIPFLALGIASALVSGWAAKFLPGTVKTLDEWGIPSRLAQALLGLAFYARKTLWPQHLAAVVELPWRFDFADPRFLGLAGAVIAGAIAIFAARKRAPALACAAAVYAFSLAPVLGFFQAGPQLVADRYSYIACMPLALLAGGGIFLGLSRFGPAARAALVACSAAALVALALLARPQAATWHDSRTLFEHAIAVGHASSVAHVNLGGLDLEAGNEASALEHFTAATKIRPDQGRAWFNLGILHARAGRAEEAERADLEAVRTMRPAFQPLVNLGNLYRNQMGRLDDAIAAYRRAVADAETGPHLGSPVPYLVLGSALRQKGLDEEGRQYLELASRYPATRPEALRELSH